LHIINFNNLCFRVENETTLISAKNRVDLSSISEVRSYITEWHRFFGPPCIQHQLYTGCKACCVASDVAYRYRLIGKCRFVVGKCERFSAAVGQLDN